MQQVIQQQKVEYEIIPGSPRGNGGSNRS